MLRESYREFKQQGRRIHGVVIWSIRMTSGNKQNAIAYVRADIAMLSEQTNDGERRAFQLRALAGLFAIHAAGMVTDQELSTIGEEIDAANRTASLQVTSRL
jgi:hypothetical protein